MYCVGSEDDALKGQWGSTQLTLQKEFDKQMVFGSKLLSQVKA